MVLLGAENYKPVNILKPEKSDIEFFVLLMFFNIIPLIVVFSAIVSVGILTMLLMVFGFCAVFYYLYRVSFLFPAKAVGAQIGMQTSYVLTEGSFWAFNMSFLRSTIRVVAVVFIYVVVLQIIVTLLTPVDDSVSLDFAQLFQPTFATHILPSILHLPLTLYFQPLLTVLGVTVLSNYYQYALQNNPKSQDVEV